MSARRLLDRVNGVVSLRLRRSKQVIRDAIMDNNFLKNLDSTQVREIVDCVYERRVKTGQFVIKEGDPGQHFYVAAGTVLTRTAMK